jgi:hypothetical protein
MTKIATVTDGTQRRQLVSQSTPPFVLNRDSQLAQTTPTDPWATFEATHTDAGSGPADGYNCIVIQNPENLPHLNLYNFIKYTSGAVSAACKIRCFGAFSMSDISANDLKEPAFFDPDNFESFIKLRTTDPATATDWFERWWQPLYNPVTGLHEIDFDTTLEYIQEGPPAYRIQHANNFVFTRGLQYVGAVISQAMTDIVGTSMVLGTFSS